MNNQSVLAIVLNYHGAEVLLPCLSSLMAELESKDACLVIDNGNEPALMEKVRANFPEVRLLSTKSNLGFAGGMNVGLRVAQEEGYSAAWILNNDTIVKKGALLALKQAAKEFPGANLFSPLIFADESKVWFAGGRINFWRMRTEHIQAFPKTIHPFETNFLTGCALFIPQETLKQVGIFDERYFLYYEDTEYSLRTRSQGGKLFVVPASKVLHREVSEANPEKIYWLVKSGVEFFSRHTPPPLSLWVRGYLLLRKWKNFAMVICSGNQLARSVKRAYTDASIK